MLVVLALLVAARWSRPNAHGQRRGDHRPAVGHTAGPLWARPGTRIGVDGATSRVMSSAASAARRGRTVRQGVVPSGHM